MITKKDNFTIEADSLSQAKFSLKDENLAHVFNILRNNLYSDKILAVLREYSCNAFDANVENDLAGTPIQVTLPTVFEPVLKIRDLGKGLSEYDVFNIFSSYGASTKRNSNSFVGTLGMGSKSGFAYAPSFTVTSYHGGYKRVYEAFIDETEIGTIAKIIEEKSDEPTGVEITVAIKKDDVRDFIAKARNFYMWFTPTPQFFGYDLNKEIDDLKSNLNKIYTSEYGTIFVDSHGFFGNNSLFVRMGNICYPVTNHTGIASDWISHPHKLIIDVQIGEVTFTTSRESLEMKDQTIHTINKYLKLIRADISQQWQAEMDAKSTGWEALCHYHRLNNFQKSILSKSLAWRGNSLKNQLPIGAGEFTKYNPNKRGGQWAAHYGNVYGVGENIWFILNDGGFPTSQTRARLNEAYDQLKSKGSVVYVRIGVTDTQNLLLSTEFQGANYLLLSSISATTLKNVKKSFKDKEKVFKWLGNTSFPYSSNWVSTDAPDNMVYVKIDCFKPVEFDWRQMKEIKDILENLGYKIDIYGVKSGGKIPANAVNLKDYITELAIKFAQTDEYIESSIDLALVNKINGTFFTKQVLNGTFASVANAVECPDVKRIMNVSYSTKTSSNFHYMKKLIDLTQQCNYHHNKLNKTLEKIQDKISKEYVNMKNCVDQCLQKYPLLNGIGSPYYTSVLQADVKNLVDYVNIVYRYHAGA
jgi:hypothetical protein